MKKDSSYYLDLIIHLLFFILFIFSIVFFKERLFSDSGYYIYRVIDSGGFAIGLNRFILLFSQILPVIAVNLGLSLKSILILYSINHVLFFYILFLISRYIYKNKVAGLLLILIQTIGIQSGFFTPMFELYYGAGFLILLDVILYKENHKLIDFILLIIITLVALTSHPFTYFLFGFILLFHFIKYRWQYIYYYLAAIVLVGIVYVFKKYTASDYEQSKTNSIIYLLHNGVYDLQYLKSLTIFLLQYYKELLVLMLITTIVFIYKKEYLKTLLYLISFLFLLILINLSYYGFEHSRYQEQVYFPLSFIVVYTFVNYVVKNCNAKYQISIYLFSSILFYFRINEIRISGNSFTERVDKMEQLIIKCRTLNGNKFIVKINDLVQNNEFEISWSIPMETMLLSGLTPNEKTITICTDDDMDTNDNKLKLKPEEYLMRCWDIREDKSVNKKYFHLEDTEYILLKD